MRGYEGAQQASGGNDTQDSVDITRSREDHARALLRLIDIANASGELLQIGDDDHNSDSPGEVNFEVEGNLPTEPSSDRQHRRGRTRV